MTNSSNSRIAGVALIASSLGFVAVFSYLASTLGYPDVLDGSAAEVLPAFVAGGDRMRAVWALYAVLPAGIALSAVLAYPLFRARGDALARLGLLAAVTASFAMTAGLMRWPTINYVLAQRFAAASPSEQRMLAVIFDAGNLYLGTITGELVGELCLSLWFFTLSIAVLRGAPMPRWLGYLGVFTSVSMAVGAFRNVAAWLSPVADLNNSLLPLWLIVLGAALALGTSERERTHGAAPSALTGQPLAAE